MFRWCCFAARGVSGLLGELFLLGPRLCFVEGFSCDLSLAQVVRWWVGDHHAVLADMRVHRSGRGAKAGAGVPWG